MIIGPAAHAPQSPARESSLVRIRWLLIVLLLLAFVAIGGPDRLLTHWAFALQQGRIQASHQELARADEVSSAFRLVAQAARPAVVRIVVRPDQADEQLMMELLEAQPQNRERLQQLDTLLNDEAIAGDERRRLKREQAALEQQITELRRMLRGSREGAGSGVIIDDSGHIVTNNHVIDSAGGITVELWDKREVPAEIIGVDPSSDVAVIRIDAPDLHTLALGDSDAMEVGDWVLAVGAPFGLSASVTHGIISAKGRTDVELRRGIIYRDFIQTDAAINPGNSGGPLLNLRGEVIGINTAIATSAEGYNAGVAFTIPSNMVRKISKQLIETGEVARGWLGINMGYLSQADRAIFGIDGPYGVMVTAVIADTPAAKAGVLYEDIVVAVNDQRVADMDELRGIIADVFPGESARLTIVRDRQPRDATVTLGRRPAARQLDRRAEQFMPLGREVEGLPLLLRTFLPDYARPNEYKQDDRGVLIVSVSGAAGDERLEVSPRDMIVACENEPVQSVGQLAAALARLRDKPAVTLRVRDPQGNRRSVLVPRAGAETP
jgi:serine protease Do